MPNGNSGETLLEHFYYQGNALRPLVGSVDKKMSPLCIHSRFVHTRYCCCREIYTSSMVANSIFIWEVFLVNWLFTMKMCLFKYSCLKCVFQFHFSLPDILNKSNKRITSNDEAMLLVGEIIKAVHLNRNTKNNLITHDIELVNVTCTNTKHQCISRNRIASLHSTLVVCVNKKYLAKVGLSSATM